MSSHTPHTPHTSHTPPVDVDRLSQLCGGDAEFEREILLSFINDTTTDLAEAKTALTEGDAVTIAGKAHRIKGSSSYMAVREMPEVAEELEKLAKQELLEGAEKLIAEIELILEAVKGFVSGDKGDKGDKGDILEVKTTLSSHTRHTDQLCLFQQALIKKNRKKIAAQKQLAKLGS